MAPADNTVLISPSSIKNISQYYTTCVGVGPFEDDYDLVLTELNVLNSTINNPIAVQTLGGLACYEATQVEVSHPNTNTIILLFQSRFPFIMLLIACSNFMFILSQLSNAYASLYQIGDDIECPYINSIYSNAVYTGICASAYNGVFGIFVVQILTASFLFFSLFGAIHFYEMWFPTHLMEGFVHEDEDEDGGAVPTFSAEYSSVDSSKLVIGKYEPVTSDTVFSDGYARPADSFYYAQPAEVDAQCYNGQQQQQYDEESGNDYEQTGYYASGYSDNQSDNYPPSYPPQYANHPSNNYNHYSGNQYPTEEEEI
jgi:hypothetical protein